MNRKPLVELSDTPMDVVMKLSKGNPGAVSVLTQMVLKGGQIDTDDCMEGLGAVLMLDTLGCYGSQIWVLYKDICGGDLMTTIALTRAVQLGYLSELEFMSAVSEQRMLKEKVDMMVRKVKERLPGFGGHAVIVT